MAAQAIAMAAQVPGQLLPSFFSLSKQPSFASTLPASSRRLPGAPHHHHHHRRHRSTQPSVVAAAAAYEFKAPSGIAIECFSRGCRPVYDDDEACWVDHDDDDDGNATKGMVSTPLEEAQESTAEHSKLFAGGLLPCQIQRLVRGVWAEPECAERYYESALKLEPRNSLLLAEYAQFAWHVLADSMRTDLLFRRALTHSPADSSVLASYASFLWQLEAS